MISIAAIAIVVAGVHQACAADDRAYVIGGGVSAPIVLTQTAPEYSEQAREAKLEGTVLLSAVIDEKGSATDIRVIRKLGMGLDGKAMECLQQWRFRPGRKAGEPVKVRVNIEVNFRLPKDH